MSKKILPRMYKYEINPNKKDKEKECKNICMARELAKKGP